ncbi:MAG: C-GCAxxG-C-C family protein [Methanomassiliicoccaceae archaeon]|nr:C-GCAxxG-C-C family protein [Methanomassiliicoccaceae archaeon]
MLTDEDFRKRFREGMDCSMQALAEIADDIYITEEEAYKLASCFGAGMLISGGACGAITGPLIALGMKYGNCEPNDFEQKAIVNSKRIEFVTRVKEAFGGCTSCKDLLGVDLMDPETRKIAREDGTIERRCPGLIRISIEILKDIL